MRTLAQVHADTVFLQSEAIVLQQEASKRGSKKETRDSSTTHAFHRRMLHCLSPSNWPQAWVHALSGQLLAARQANDATVLPWAHGPAIHEYPSPTLSEEGGEVERGIQSAWTVDRGGLGNAMGWLGKPDRIRLRSYLPTLISNWPASRCISSPWLCRKSYCPPRKRIRGPAEQELLPYASLTTGKVCHRVV